MIFQLRPHKFMIVFDSGKKIRVQWYTPKRPRTIKDIESIDIKITDECNMGCVFCHESSTPAGKHGDIMSLKLPHNTELAIGGGNPLSHPDLHAFLAKHRYTNHCALTVHSNHAVQNQNMLRNYLNAGLIKGLGISMCKLNPKVDFNTLFGEKHRHKIVKHVILGVDTAAEILRQAEGSKILILGYKHFGNGEVYAESQMRMIELKLHSTSMALRDIVDTAEVVGFDTLSAHQLHLDKKGVRYWGENTSMFLDAVTRKVYPSSYSALRR